MMGLVLLSGIIFLTAYIGMKLGIGYGALFLVVEIILIKKIKDC